MRLYRKIVSLLYFLLKSVQIVVWYFNALNVAARGAYEVVMVVVFVGSDGVVESVVVVVMVVVSVGFDVVADGVEESVVVVVVVVVSKFCEFELGNG